MRDCICAFEYGIIYGNDTGGSERRVLLKSEKPTKEIQFHIVGESREAAESIYLEERSAKQAPHFLFVSCRVLKPSLKPRLYYYLSPTLETSFLRITSYGMQCV